VREPRFGLFGLNWELAVSAPFIASCQRGSRLTLALLLCLLNFFVLWQMNFSDPLQWPLQIFENSYKLRRLIVMLSPWTLKSWLNNSMLPWKRKKRQSVI
jgi:hypothetical protein